METIRIPVRAIYKRAPRGCSAGWEPQMTGAVYADVPVQAVRGVIGDCALAGARLAHDDGAVEVINRALDKAEIDGVAVRMR